MSKFGFHHHVLFEMFLVVTLAFSLMEPLRTSSAWNDSIEVGDIYCSPREIVLLLRQESALAFTYPEVPAVTTHVYTVVLTTWMESCKRAKVESTC